MNVYMCGAHGVSVPHDSIVAHEQANGQVREAELEGSILPWTSVPTLTEPGQQILRLLLPLLDRLSGRKIRPGGGRPKLVTICVFQHVRVTPHPALHTPPTPQ